MEGKPYWGEKTPAHAFRVDTLRESFPECSIIHIVRDPRDAVSSLIRMSWSNRSVAAAARLWSRSNAAAGRVANHESYLWVKYENLVTSPGAELTRICRHIGLDYDGALLLPKAIPAVARPAVARANRPITTERLEVWRQVLEPWQLAAVEEIADPLMGEYGYRRETDRTTLSDRVKAFVEAVVEVGLQTASRLPCAYFRYVRPANLEAEERWIERAGSMYWSVRPAAGRVD